MDPELNQRAAAAPPTGPCLTNPEFHSPEATPPKRGETAAHRELKRLALIWAQEHDYPLAALEISLPKSRYRADVVAYQPRRDGTLGHTAVFECKQSRPDLRRDDCRSQEMRQRLETVYHRQQIIERNLRIHYPTLRCGETLFPEWDDFDFAAIKHRGYRRIVRELSALRNQLRDGRKFEKLTRYGCANLFYLVVPNDLMPAFEAPLGWGLLSASEGRLVLVRKPFWHEVPDCARLRLLQRIAAAGTRQLNRRLEINLVRPISTPELANPLRESPTAGRTEISS